MAKRIICNLPVGPKEDGLRCDGVIGHKVSDRMVDIRRQDKQAIKTFGNNFSQLATCPKCKREHTITVKDATMTLPDVVELQDIPVEPDPADPNDPNNVTPPSE